VKRSSARRGGLTDAALIDRTLAGDEHAFAEVYRRHLPLLLRWCLYQTHTHELAADLASEVFAQALISASNYDEQEGELLPWLLGIARNKLRESRRRRRVESGAREKLMIEPLAFHDGDIERVEELASLQDELLHGVSQLPEDQRDALLARVVDERSYEQIAGELHCSQAVVRQRVSRGLKTLREQVSDR
jgi:RNA polymerase sigma factor (sigma-70 family)